MASNHFSIKREEFVEAKKKEKKRDAKIPCWASPSICDDIPRAYVSDDEYESTNNTSAKKSGTRVCDGVVRASSSFVEDEKFWRGLSREGVPPRDEKKTQNAR